MPPHTRTPAPPAPPAELPMLVAVAAPYNAPTVSDLQSPQDTPLPKFDWTDPTNIGTLLLAVLTAVGFGFHKDLSPLAGPLTSLALAAVVAVQAIAHANKVNAVVATNAQKRMHHASLVQDYAKHREQLTTNVSEMNASLLRNLPQ